ncbi:MAG: hypothetical protein SFU99_08950 [Saprospiraceae bacterium]|nr:hypothetical protein [Saprospiraceae bacterium]
MKKYILFTIITLASGILFAQNDKYIKAMEKALTQLDTVQTAEGFQKVANTFERIAMNEKSEWLPAYYQAYCNMMIAVAKMQAEDIPTCIAFVDKAQAALDAAKALAPQESEIITLQGYVYQGRIWENPMVKGAEYSPKIQEAFQTAIALNPENPRPYYLFGQQLLYTPEFYGGGAKSALPWLEKAEAKYASYQAPSSIHPTWGNGANNYMLDTARKQISGK